MLIAPFTDQFALNWEGLVRNIRREGTPDRVYFIELFLDRQTEDAIDRRYGVTAGLDPGAPDFEARRAIAMNRFLGYEGVPAGVLRLDTGVKLCADDTTEGETARESRSWINEKEGVITSWEEFDAFPWPDGRNWNTSLLEWYEKNLPDDMCVVGRGGHFCEYLCWLMGYETLCYALYEQPDLVRALADRILELEESACRVLVQFERVKIVWASDDLGFKTGPMISPEAMREYVFPGHKRLAEIAHAAGRPYLLHACGDRHELMDDLIDDVKIDAIHSWEDTIETITDAKRAYGDRVALLGGIDVDFLCRASEGEIRQRVRETVAECQPGGGFCLGSGNSVANYVPIDSYLAMIDEGRKCS